MYSKDAWFFFCFFIHWIKKKNHFNDFHWSLNTKTRGGEKGGGGGDSENRRIPDLVINLSPFRPRYISDEVWFSVLRIYFFLIKSADDNGLIIAHPHEIQVTLLTEGSVRPSLRLSVRPSVRLLLKKRRRKNSPHRYRHHIRRRLCSHVTRS